MTRPARLLLIALLALGLLVPALWYLAVPLDLLTANARFTLDNSEAEFLFENLSKGLPFSVTADRLSVRTVPGETRREPLEIGCTSFRGSIPFGGLVSFSPSVSFSCSAYRGIISGSAGLRSPREIMVRGSGISMAEAPLATLYGLRGEGTLSFDYRGTSRGGELTFLVEDARLTSDLLPASFSLKDFRTVRGILDIRGGGADIRSLTLESPVMYARIKGHVGASTTLLIEIMTDNPGALDPSYAKALEPYVVIPGHWSIPFGHSKTPSR